VPAICDPLTIFSHPRSTGIPDKVGTTASISALEIVVQLKGLRRRSVGVCDLHSGLVGAALLALPLRAPTSISAPSSNASMNVSATRTVSASSASSKDSQP
jgi:hypothetical protein